MYISSSHLSHARLRPLALNAIQITDGFWKNWQRVNLEKAIPHGYRMLEKSGTLDNMRIAAEQRAGITHDANEFRGYVFQDSDIYKWLEAASLSLGQQWNDDIASNLQSLISNLHSAQFPDGYLDSYFTFVKPNERWTDLEWAHEMYCAGHLIEAGIARKRATGDTDLFEIAKKFADCIDATFGEGKRAGLCGHPEIELALVELYRETNDARYLKLAQYFIDQRGHNTFQGLRHIGALYMQDHVPVRDAETVAGHAVRQLYLCAGVADLFLETGERALLAAMERLWQDMTRGKMYITGGVGARGYGEMFGDAYELPTKEAYCETCAAIASMMWNWRMLLATNDARYAELFERVMYNGFLSGIALDGEHFFYENPLRSDGNIKREEWFACACCPPNVMRTLALVANYCATTSDAGIQIHQYMNVRLGSEKREARIETNYPWDGNVRVICESDGEFEIALRIPRWSTHNALRVNGTLVEMETRDGYTNIKRTWRAGDVIELELDMTPRFIESHPYVDATHGCVAIERGPLVYCIEQVDQDADVNDLRVNVDGKLRAVWDENVCGGVMMVEAEGGGFDAREWEDELYRETRNVRSRRSLTPRNEKREMERATIRAIPYYAWNNRGPDKMRVWIPCK